MRELNLVHSMCSEEKLRDSTLCRFRPRTRKINVLADLITCLDLSNFFTAGDGMPALGHFWRLLCPLKSLNSKSLNTQIWAAAQGGIQQLFSFSVLPTATQHWRCRAGGSHPWERSCCMVISQRMDKVATVIQGTKHWTWPRGHLHLLDTSD